MTETIDLADASEGDQCRSDRGPPVTGRGEKRLAELRSAIEQERQAARRLAPNSAALPAAHFPLLARRILVVEDDFLVSTTLAGFLEAAGACVLGPIGRLDETLAFIEDNYRTLDAVVLDINLHGVMAYPIADRLRACGVKFVVATAYGGGVNPLDSGNARLVKPFSETALIAAVLGAIGRSR